MRKILIIATGGTIASVPHDRGLAPALDGEELVRRVPQLADIAEISVVQPMNIDSTNMQPQDWLAIAHVIAGSYDAFDGFVVLHGTDTMAYTAAALSYLLQDSPKPIVLTGSQQPMAAPFTDAKLNLYQSVLFAADPCARDVAVVFNGKAIAGTRAHKQRTMSYNAFTSMNYPTLAYIRAGRVIWSGLMDPTPSDHSAKTLKRYTELDSRVIVLKLTPGLKPSIFSLLAHDYDAAIIETFGIGGIPTSDHEAFAHAIFGWVESGHTIVLTTQVPEEGLDLGVYEVGHAYQDHPGILLGGDMTTEALLAKTMWALGQTRDTEELASLFSLPVNHDRTRTAEAT